MGQNYLLGVMLRGWVHVEWAFLHNENRYKTDLKSHFELNFPCKHFTRNILPAALDAVLFIIPLQTTNGNHLL